MDDIIEVWRGMSAYSSANPDKPFNSYNKDSEYHRPLLNGGDINKYAINWKGEFIKYGKWLHRPRPYYIYDKPHLLIQRIRNPRLQDRIIAAYDDEKYISSDGLSILLLRDESQSTDILKFTLALLNSKLINYWFSFYFFDVNIKPEQVRKIPIKNTVIMDEIINKVNSILKLKKQDPNFDIILLEDQINHFVYQLYDLTEEEIKIVESSFEQK